MIALAEITRRFDRAVMLTIIIRYNVSVRGRVWDGFKPIGRVYIDL